MKRISKYALTFVLALSLTSTSSVLAADISKDSIRGGDGNALLNVTTAIGSGDYGQSNGSALQAKFRTPSSVLILADGAIVIADTTSHQIRKATNGNVAAFAGALIPVGVNDQGLPVGGILDGQGDQAFFNSPSGIAADASGNIYVADKNDNAIRKIDASGNVTTLAGSGLVGSSNGTGKEAKFNQPEDVAVAKDGTVYVADTLNHLIRKITVDGTVSTLNATSNRSVEVFPGLVESAGDFQDGDLAQALFNEPSGLALDAKGNLYVSDTGNQRIRYIDFAAGKVSTVAGGVSGAASTTVYSNPRTDLYAIGDWADGAADKAVFNFPKGIAVTAEGGLLIADSKNNIIRYLIKGKVSTLLGTAGTKTGETDGAERIASFNNPVDVAVAADGSLLIADAFNNKIRKATLYQLPAGHPKNGTIQVALGSKLIAFDAKPELKNNRTMVPVSAIAQAAGFKVIYASKGSLVQLIKGDLTIELTIGKTGLVRKETGKADVVKKTDAAPYVKSDRTYVPARFFAEEIGYDVQWDSQSQTAIIR